MPVREESPQSRPHALKVLKSDTLSLMTEEEWKLYQADLTTYSVEKCLAGVNQKEFEHDGFSLDQEKGIGHILCTTAESAKWWREAVAKATFGALLPFASDVPRQNNSSNLEIIIFSVPRSSIKSLGFSKIIRSILVANMDTWDEEQVNPKCIGLQLDDVNDLVLITTKIPRNVIQELWHKTASGRLHWPGGLVKVDWHRQSDSDWTANSEQSFRSTRSVATDRETLKNQTQTKFVSSTNDKRSCHSKKRKSLGEQSAKGEKRRKSSESTVSCDGLPGTSRQLDEERTVLDTFKKLLRDGLEAVDEDKELPPLPEQLKRDGFLVVRFNLDLNFGFCWKVSGATALFRGPDKISTNSKYDVLVREYLLSTEILLDLRSCGFLPAEEVNNWKPEIHKMLGLSEDTANPPRYVMLKRPYQLFQSVRHGSFSLVPTEAPREGSSQAVEASATSETSSSSSESSLESEGEQLTEEQSELTAGTEATPEPEIEDQTTSGTIDLDEPDPSMPDVLEERGYKSAHYDFDCGIGVAIHPSTGSAYIFTDPALTPPWIERFEGRHKRFFCLKEVIATVVSRITEKCDFRVEDPLIFEIRLERMLRSQIYAFQAGGDSVIASEDTYSYVGPAIFVE